MLSQAKTLKNINITSWSTVIKNKLTKRKSLYHTRNVLSLSTVVTAACSDVGVPCKISASTRTRPRPPKPPQYFLTPIPPSPPCAVTDNWPVKSFMAWHWYSQIKSQSIFTKWHQWCLSYRHSICILQKHDVTTTFYRGCRTLKGKNGRSKWQLDISTHLQ